MSPGLQEETVPILAKIEAERVRRVKCRKIFAKKFSQMALFKVRPLLHSPYLTPGAVFSNS